MVDETQVPYVCGPLTDLMPEHRERVLPFYEKIGDLCEEILGVRAFVPHEHFDPVTNPNATPDEVYATESVQVSQLTSLLIVVAEGPSWGGGMEVQMCNEWGTPIILMYPDRSLKKPSRLLRGSPMIVHEIEYRDFTMAEVMLRSYLEVRKDALAAYAAGELPSLERSSDRL